MDKMQSNGVQMQSGPAALPAVSTYAHLTKETPQSFPASCLCISPSTHLIPRFMLQQRLMLTSLAEAHLKAIAIHLENNRKRQAQRWVDFNMSTGDILGYQNEIRWGLKTGNTHYMSDEAQSAVERLERERTAALDRLNREKVARAKPGAVVESEVWVDDW